jgi:hypothetical protein
MNSEVIRNDKTKIINWTCLEAGGWYLPANSSKRALTDYPYVCMKYKDGIYLVSLHGTLWCNPEVNDPETFGYIEVFPTANMVTFTYSKR